jgi:hypothetical protein
VGVEVTSEGINISIDGAMEGDREGESEGADKTDGDGVLVGW